HSLLILLRPPPLPTLFPYTTLFRSVRRTSGSSATCSATPTSGGSTRAPTCPSRATSRAGGGRATAVSSRSTSSSRSAPPGTGSRSEEHTSELQSRGHLVCRLLLEKK